MIDYAGLNKKLSKNISTKLEELLKNTPNIFNAEASTISIKKGTTFIHSYDEANTIYILVKGQVKAVDYHIDEIIYDYTSFEPIEFLGAMEFYMGLTNYITDLETLTDCLFITFTVDTFRSWIEKDTTMMLKLIQIMMNRLNDQARKERTFMFLTAKERIMYLLVSIYHLYHQEGECEVKLTQDELAKRSGINLRTATRSIQSLCEEKLLEKRNRKLYVTKLQCEQMEKILGNRLGDYDEKKDNFRL